MPDFSRGRGTERFVVNALFEAPFSPPFKVAVSTVFENRIVCGCGRPP